MFYLLIIVLLHQVLIYDSVNPSILIFIEIVLVIAGPLTNTYLE
jgi:hypothetical protein